MTHHARTTRNVFAAVVVTLMLTAFSLAQYAQYSETPLYTFTGPNDGAVPLGQFVSDSAGNFYGTTVAGGNNSTSCEVVTGVPGCGVVFKLTPNGKYTVLYTFSGGKDGGVPFGGVILDSAGTLYGTTYAGGDEKPKVCQAGSNYAAGCGVVFKLTPTGKYTVLYTFTGGKDGAGPNGVVLDSSGNLYGAGNFGGDKLPVCRPFGCGVVFKLTRPKNHRGKWIESVPYHFGSVSAGIVPSSGVTFDSRGNLYGATYAGGDKSVKCNGSQPGCGVVFKLAPTGKGPWTETVLHAFTGGKDGASPQGTPFADKKGNVYGTTVVGGYKMDQCANVGRGLPPGCGVVYELTPRANGAWAERVLHTFTGGSDGELDRTPVVFDSAGNLYGSTVNGGDPNCNNGYGCGTVFELTPPKTKGGKWGESVLYAFALGTDGGIPQTSLLFDSAGDIFGTTAGGGDDSDCLVNNYADYGCGVVFELTPGGSDLGRAAGGPGLSRVTAAGGSPSRSAR